MAVISKLAEVMITATQIKMTMVYLKTTPTSTMIAISLVLMKLRTIVKMRMKFREVLKRFVSQIFNTIESS